MRIFKKKIWHSWDHRVMNYIEGKALPFVINFGDFSLSVLLYCGFRSVIQTDSYCSIQQTERFYRQGKPRNWRRGGRGCLCFYKNISSLDETYSSPHGRKSLIFLVTLSPLMNNQLSQLATAPYIYSYHASPPLPPPPTPLPLQPYNA